MSKYVLLTASGADRPGIVSAIARVLFENGCNIEDSQSARLGPDFACMLVIRIPDVMVREQLADRLRGIAGDLKLLVNVHDLKPEEVEKARTELPRYLIHVYGADHPGIVYGISEHLAGKRVNVTSLQTEVVHHETPLYVMMIEVEIPAGLDVGSLQEELVAIGRKLDVVVAMKPKDDARF